MNTEARAHLKQLLEGQRVLSLAVVIDGKPHIGLLPFAVLQDHIGVLVHVSTLAKHTRGLASAVPVAVLVHQSEEAVSDPLQVPRVSMQTEVKELERGSAEYEAGKERFLARFPDAAVTFELGDFQLFELRFVQGRFIEGFARAMDITMEDLKAMGPPEPARKHSGEMHERRRWSIPRE
jgi:putative heme iron utilization protein